MIILPMTRHGCEALAVALRWRREYPEKFTSENIDQTVADANRAAWINLDAQDDQVRIDEARALDAALPDPEPYCSHAALSRGCGAYADAALRGD